MIGKHFRIQMCLLALFISLLFVRAAHAHGEGKILEIADVPIGPYFLNVWSGPGVLRAGEVHFTALVVDENNVPVSNCNVKLQLTPLNGNNDETILLQTRPATLETFFEHETEYNLDREGRYEVAVIVTDSSNNGGTAVFNIEIIKIPFWIQASLYLAVGLASFLALFLFVKGIILFGLWQPASQTIGRRISKKNPRL
jgi:hypothetical protein